MSHSSFPGRISLFQPLEPRTLFSDNPPVIAPRNLTAVATSATAVKLHWTDLSVNETGFQVERSENFSTFEVVIITGPGATAWTDDDLSPGTQYTYRVRANSALTDSDYSGSSTVVTPPSSFADRDGSGTLFLHANTGIDTIIVTDTGSSIDVDVNGATASFDDTLEPVSKISLITADNDHSITVDNNGALTLKGDGQANDFVGLSGDDTVVNVKINGSVTTFSKTLVNRITVMTFVGADRISVSSAVGPVNVNGGDGNDTIFGGTGDDRLDGGKGDDLIKGEDGNDYITGGEGNDFLYGQNGADTLLGGNGDDKLVAGDGIDSVIGGDGRDRLYGTVNQDILKGGDGKDSIIQF